MVDGWQLKWTLHGLRFFRLHIPLSCFAWSRAVSGVSSLHSLHSLSPLENRWLLGLPGPSFYTGLPLCLILMRRRGDVSTYVMDVMSRMYLHNYEWHHSIINCTTVWNPFSFFCSDIYLELMGVQNEHIIFTIAQLLKMKAWNPAIILFSPPQ